MKIEFVETQNVPKLCDLDLPNRSIPGNLPSYQDYRLRVKIKVPELTRDYQERIDRKRKEIESRYPQATVLVVPEFIETQKAETLDWNVSDQRKIATYVHQTLPNELRQDEKEIVSYLDYQLKKTSAQYHQKLSREEIRFQEVEAENVLCFKKIKLKFQPGIWILSGRNEDWGNGSNGSGKSSLIQLLRIALFGKTTKGQDCDRLIRRNSGPLEPVVIAAEWECGKVPYRAERKRRPVKLRLFRKERDISSGNSQKKTGISTQELVRQAAGMTEEMFDHSILIDQKLLHLASGFLNGTDKEKKELLDSFLGTERWLAAGERIKMDQSLNEKQIEKARQLILTEENILEAYEREKRQQEKEKAIEVHRLLRIIKRQRKFLHKIELKGSPEKLAKKASDEYREAAEQSRAAATDWSHRQAEVTIQTRRVFELEIKLNELRKPDTIGKICPQCQQTIQAEHVVQCIQDVKKKLAVENKTLRRLKNRRDQVADLNSRKSKRVERKEEELSAATDKRLTWEAARKEITTYQTLIQKARLSRKNRRLERMINRTLGKLSGYRKGLKAMKRRAEFLEYASRVFSRKGVVNFLYQEICQKLNIVAREYSEMFTSGMIQLQFSAETEKKSGDVKDEISIQVINLQGGENRTDQSRGEEQLATLMCVLCLREIGPRSNLLMLDEPTEGLDVVNARKFAEGLEKLRKKFSCIILATHNQDIRTRWGEACNLTVVKKNRIARLEETR